jgi:hypothetical protein
MLTLLMFGGGATAGYVLAIQTWPAVRSAIVGAEQELAWLRSRVFDLEAKLRAALGRGEQ